MGTDVAAPVTGRGAEAGVAVLTVNGQARELRIEPRVSLLDALREHLGRETISEFQWLRA